MIEYKKSGYYKQSNCKSEDNLNMPAQYHSAKITFIPQSDILKNTMNHQRICLTIQ